MTQKMDTGNRKGATPEVQDREMRFIVHSAEEAVRKVRESLGPDAKVVSVQQVRGSGLQRFLAAPRLEIIARAPETVEKAAPPEPEPKPEPPPQPEGTESPPQEKSGSLPVAGTGEEKEANLTCRKFLARAGIPEVVAGRLEGAREWREIGDMDVREGLHQAVQWLRKYKNGRGVDRVPARAAFLGGPGAGKTTALCKLLAREVFLNGRTPTVLRLEVDKPHLDDGLPLYCEVLGIPCARSVAEVDPRKEENLYVDLPGFSLREKKEQDRIGEALDELGLSERILVLNAAYEEAIMRKFRRVGHRLHARHHILTHIDELESFGKLWEFLLDPEVQVLFFSDGQNVAGDRVEDPFGYLLERTFPR